MKIIGIGIDILNTNRIKNMNYNKQNNLAKKILHPIEIKHLKYEKKIYNFLSYRFCIKEALFKALGIGIRNKLFFNQIEVIHDKYGKPDLKIYNIMFDLIKSLNISKIHVSLSHDSNISCSLIILE